MEITFHKVGKVKIAAVKSPFQAGGTWLQINVCDQEGEHLINCFRVPGEAIQLSMYPMGEDDD